MALRVSAALAAATFLCVLVAAPAGASSVAYIDNNNVVLSSPDGSKKFQMTTNGTADSKWSYPSQGPDGKTVAVLGASGTSSKVLYLFGPDGKEVTANVMPVYSGALIPVYPIGLDMDWKSQAVAYGYSYCSSYPSVCGTVYQGFWLTFSDNQGLYPSDPQGQSDAHLPTFFGERVIYSDSGGSLFIQPDVPEAPFTSSYQGWIGNDPNLFLARGAAAQTGRQVGIEWSSRNDSSSGILVGQHQGTLPSTVDSLCDLPVVGESGNVSFSPDGQFVAWADAEGVKVAGAPNLAAGTQACTLSSPVRVLSATGTSPDFGGADVARILGDGNGPGPGPGSGGSLTAKAKGKPTYRTFLKGKLAIVVNAVGAGRVDASASLARKLAKRIGIGATASTSVRALAAGRRGLAAANAVVVGRGHKSAAQAGAVTIKLKPTKAAKRAGRKLKGKKLAVSVSQGPARGKLSVKLR
jgi:hypothetical protein